MRSQASLWGGTGWTAVKLTPPNADSNRVILYVRGGSFTTGSVPGSWAYPVYRIARASDAAVLILNYRLAPENPFPAARDDVVSAYEYLMNHGYRSQNIVFAGDSAGGWASTSSAAKSARQ